MAHEGPSFSCSAAYWEVCGGPFRGALPLGGNLSSPKGRLIRAGTGKRRPSEPAVRLPHGPHGPLAGGAEPEQG